MKTLEEIQEEVKSILKNWNWPDKDVNQLFESVCVMTLVEEVAHRFAKEVTKEALKNASERARLIAKEYDCDCGNTHLDWNIDKQSILNESNIPEL